MSLLLNEVLPRKYVFRSKFANHFASLLTRTKVSEALSASKRLCFDAYQVANNNNNTNPPS